MIRKARINDLEDIWQLRLETSKLLNQRGIDQWQYHLPDKKTFQNDIKLNEFYIYEIDSHIVGMIAIKEGIEPTYLKIYDGNWSADKAYLTIHRLAVKSRFLGKNIAKELILFAHSIAKNQGINYIRIDTHEDNRFAVKLFESLDYKLKGYIYLAENHVGDKKRLAYDILL